jgi:hypothetical protein
MSDEMEEKFKKMGLDELVMYKNTARLINYIAAAIGIGSILFMLFFTSMLVVIPCTAFLFIAAITSAGVDVSLKTINQRIDKLSDK